MLFDNSGFGCINNLQMANGSDSFFCEFRDSDNQIMQVDYAKIAEGYGAKVYRANTKEDLISALEDAKTNQNNFNRYESITKNYVRRLS